MGAFQQCVWVLSVFTMTGIEGGHKVSRADTRKNWFAFHAVLWCAGRHPCG